MSLSVIAPAALRIDVDPHLVLRQLRQRVHERPDRTLDVGLDDQVELGDLVALGPRHQLLQGRRARRHHLGRADLRLALLHDVARRALVLDLADVVARVRGRRPAEDLHRLAGPGLLHLLPVLVEHRADLRPRGAGDDGVAHVERATLDEHARHRAAALVQVRLEHDPASAADRVALELLQIGHQQDRVEQVVQVGARLGRDVDELDRPAPLRRDEPLLHQLLPNAGGVGLRLVDLVHRDQDLHARRLRVVERLDRLRLHAVVRRDHQDRDVGHLGAAGTHRGERLVTRGVDEGDLAPVGVHLVRADVLGDPAELLRDDVGLADRVQQEGLPVVDVTHDRDDRRPGLERGSRRSPPRAPQSSSTPTISAS